MTDSALNENTIRIEYLSLAQIVPSETNPRTNFAYAKLQELAESIRLKGVLQPILVRPMASALKIQPPSPGINRWSISNKFGTTLETFATEDVATIALDQRIAAEGSKYELIAGERRYRAARIAGLKTIPALIREIDDKSALEIQVIENLQRSDLSPLEESLGYEGLIRDHGYTAYDLATKIGKSRTYVYGRLKLCNLPAEIQQEIAIGNLAASIGELIGRLPSERMRLDCWDKFYSDRRNEWFTWPSYRDMRESIEREYMRELKGASFNRKSKNLMTEAGACTACPKMTGNNRIEYPDGRADICTDPGCYDRKVIAAKAAEIEKIRKAGAPVIEGSAAKEIFRSERSGRYWLNYDADYIDPEEICDEWTVDETMDKDYEDKTYKDLIGQDVAPVLAIDPSGQTWTLLPKNEVYRVLKEKHGIEDPRLRKGPVDTSNSNYEERVAKIEAQKIELKLRTTIAERIYESVENETSNAPEEFSDKLWPLVAEMLLQRVSRLALPALERRSVSTDAGESRLWSGSLTPIDAQSFIAEVIAREELQDWIYGHLELSEIMAGEGGPSIFKLLDIDLEQFYSEAVAKPAADHSKQKPAKAA